MVGQPDYLAVPKHFDHGAFRYDPRHFLNDIESLAQITSTSFGQGPSGQLLRYVIHEFNVAVGIGGDDGVADALQGRGPTLLAGAQRLLGLLALGDVHEVDAYDPGIRRIERLKQYRILGLDFVRSGLFRAASI